MSSHGVCEFCGALVDLEGCEKEKCRMARVVRGEALTRPKNELWQELRREAARAARGED